MPESDLILIGIGGAGIEIAKRKSDKERALFGVQKKTIRSLYVKEVDGKQQKTEQGIPLLCFV